MDIEADAARAEVVLVFFADQADVAEQASQQGLVDRLVAAGNLTPAAGPPQGGGIVYLWSEANRRHPLPRGGGWGVGARDLPAMLVAQRHQLRMNVAPFAQAKPVDEVLPAPLALLVRGLVLPDFVAGGPEFQVGQELGFLVLPLGMGLVRRRRMLLRPVARVLGAKGRSNDQHLAQAVVLARGEDHAADLGVEWQLGEFETDLGQILRRLVDRAQLRQQLVTVGDHARRRRFEEGEILDVAQMQRLHAQDHAGQAGTQDLRLGVGRALVKILFVVELEADAGRNAAATTGPLACRRARDRLDLQLLDLVPMRVALDARQTGVDHVADAGHGERGLGDIGRQHHALALMRGEDAALLDRCLACEQRQHFKAGRMVLPQRLRRLAYLALAGEEDQDVARSGAMRFIHRVDDGIVEVAVFLLLPGAEARFDRVETARDLDHRRALEVLRKPLGVQRCRGDDDFQVAPLGQKLLEVAEQEIDVEAALVCFVDQYRVVLAQQRIGLGFGKQDAVGHQLDVGGRRDLVGEADLEADMAAEFRFEFFADARCGGARGDAPRLGVADQAVEAATDFEADLRQLRGLARTRLAADHHHLVLEYGLADLRPALVDRQRLVIDQRGPRRPPRLGIKPHCASLWTVKMPNPVISSEPNRCKAAAPAAQP